MLKVYYYDSAKMRHHNKDKLEQIRDNIDEMFNYKNDGINKVFKLE